MGYAATGALGSLSAGWLSHAGSSAALRKAQLLKSPTPTSVAPIIEAPPPPLRPLLMAIAAGALARGLLLPFHLLVSSELNGWRTLASRALSSLVLAQVAAQALDASTSLRLALGAGFVAGLIGMAGGIADRVGILTLSAMFSTFGCERGRAFSATRALAIARALLAHPAPPHRLHSYRRRAPSAPLASSGALNTPLTRRLRAHTQMRRSHSPKQL